MSDSWEENADLPGVRRSLYALSLANPLLIFEVLWVHRGLIGRLARREVLQRYRGSAFGLLWSLFHPLLMLGVFMFVFGKVLPVRTGQAAPDTPSFGLMLFAGLVVFWMLSECLSRAPRLVLENPAFVKRVVFPLEILPWVVVLSALFHTGVNSVILLAATWVLQGSVPWTVATLPLVFVPVALLGLGACWFFSALGVYVRDIQQVMPVLVMALMFLTPIFYSSDALPEAYRSILLLNPLAGAVEQTRAVTLAGVLPDWSSLLSALLLSWALASLSLAWFVRTRWGFADVV
jgi:lipopolysaccharide transport system permease protein